MLLVRGGAGICEVLQKVVIWQRKGHEQLAGRVESFKIEFGRFALGKSKKTSRTEIRGHVLEISVD